MPNTNLADRLLRLPPRQLELTPARALLGVVAPIASAAGIVIFYYPLFLKWFVLPEAEYQNYVHNFMSVHPVQFWLPILLGPFANMSTLIDMFRGRKLTFRRRLMLFCLIWAASLIPITLYWIGEFSKMAREPVDQLGPETSQQSCPAPLALED
jgi:hypothetical protein